jgi:hypothetical protein
MLDPVKPALRAERPPLAAEAGSLTATQDEHGADAAMAVKQVNQGIACHAASTI